MPLSVRDVTHHHQKSTVSRWAVIFIVHTLSVSKFCIGPNGIGNVPNFCWETSVVFHSVKLGINGFQRHLSTVIGGRWPDLHDLFEITVFVCIFFMLFFPINYLDPKSGVDFTPGDCSRDMNRIELVETHSTSWQRDSVSTKNNEKKKEGKKSPELHVTWRNRMKLCRFLSFWPNCGWNCRPALILNGKWRSFMPLKPAWARAS